MTKIITFALLALFINATAFTSDADARRFGGGSSFGKSFNKQKSVTKPAAPATPNQGINKSPSRAGGMMGLLGGLAMGGLLGALFFGGAFEGINFMDILMIGGVLFLIFFLMRRAAASRQQQYAPAGHHNQSFGHQQHTSEQNDNQNDAFMGAATSTSADKPVIDAAHFTQAARDIFTRMQQDWDAKNEEDIRSFCTPEIANHIMQDMASIGDNKTRTDIGMLRAEIADTWIESGMEWVAVQFEAKLKEETLNMAGAVVETENTEVNEIWIFQHTPNSNDPTWYIAGIQQA